VFSEEFKSELQGYEALQVFRDHADRAKTEDALQLVQYLDFKTYLPGDILTKVDRASMAHSLEVRVPILEHHFVEWAATVPTSAKLDGSEGKACFKRALEPYLPHDIMYRQKMGFSVPITSWFRNELREKLRETVLSDRLRSSAIFDLAYIERLLNEHQSGARNHSPLLWALAMFVGFLETLEESTTSGCGK
jgi:asparagine synthase (glutamine-hydrolysing)